ncbi:hypothetical protein [Noviherbaspirillum sp.]|uniref:hypothetical protein n=1 Tax=Noviherbaspirillum sp. TaxID=1926288 RepID=UPI002FE3DA33
MNKPILLVEHAPNDIEFALRALHQCGVTNDIIEQTMEKRRAITFSIVNNIGMRHPATLA